MRLLAGIFAVVAATGGIALAAAPSGLVSVPDGDDTPVVFDIARLDVQQNKDKRIQAKFTFHESFQASDLAPSDRTPGSVCLKLYTGRRAPSSSPPQYLACVTTVDEGQRFRGSVLQEAANETLRRVGTVAVTRPNATTLILRFAPTRIGSPRRLRFAGEAIQQVGCPQPRGCLDRAPNSVRTRSFTLVS